MVNCHSQNLFLGVLGEFRGMGCQFSSFCSFFRIFFLFLLLSFGIITENTNLWCKNSMMIKTIPIFRGICFLSFFLWNFSRKCCTIWKVLEAFCRGPEDPRSDRIYSSRNRGVKKDLGPGTLKSKTAAVKLKSLPPQQATHRQKSKSPSSARLSCFPTVINRASCPDNLSPEVRTLDTTDKK